MSRLTDRLKNNRTAGFSVIYGAAVLIIAGAVCLAGVRKGASQDPICYAAETDMLTDYAQSGFLTDDIGLDKGIYTLTVSYETNGFASLKPVSAEGAECTSELMLTPYSGYTESYIYASGGESHIQFEVTPSYEGMTLHLLSIAVYRMPGLTGVNNALKVLGAALILYLTALLVFFLRSGAEKEKKQVLLGILTVIVIASAGLIPWIFNGYIAGGHDVEAHMGRIAAIASGLKNHVFPVRMYRYFENDFGYPMGIFYGDIFLYPPALLHLGGVPLWICYVIYAVMMNILTTVIAYISFKTISGRRDIGLLTAAVYTLSLWRLNDVYIRAAAGEYGAFAFLPLIALGLYLAANGTLPGSAGADLYKGNDGTGPDRYKTILFLSLVFGLTGVIHTHMITCVMIFVFALIYCLIFIKRIIKSGSLKTMIFSGAAALALNAGFIIPFADMYLSGDYVVRHLTHAISGQGVHPLQLLSFRGDYADISHSLDEGLGMFEEMPFTLGPVLIFILILTVAGLIRGYIRVPASGSSQRPASVFATVLTVLSLLAIFMTTCFFPYDAMDEHISPVAGILGGVQFPWRYLVMATLIISVLTIYVCRIWDKKVLRIVLWAVTVVSALVFMGMQLAADNKHTDAVSAEGIRLSLMDSDIMYLPQDMDPESLKDGKIRMSEEAVTSQDMGFDGRSHTVIADVPGDSEGWLEIPRIYYGGYHSYTVDGNGDVRAVDQYKLTEGDDHRIRLLIPGGSRDMVEIRYSEPLYYRLAEIISLLAFAGISAWIIKDRRRKRTKSE